MWANLGMAGLLFVFAFAQNAAASAAGRAESKLWSVSAANANTALDALLIFEGYIIGREEWVPLWAILCALPGGWLGSYWMVERKKVQHRMTQLRRAAKRVARRNLSLAPESPVVSGEATSEAAARQAATGEG